MKLLMAYINLMFRFFLLFWLKRGTARNFERVFRGKKKNFISSNNVIAFKIIVIKNNKLKIKDFFKVLKKLKCSYS